MTFTWFRLYVRAYYMVLFFFFFLVGPIVLCPPVAEFAFTTFLSLFVVDFLRKTQTNKTHNL